jgi:hypothetical protein
LFPTLGGGADSGGGGAALGAGGLLGRLQVDSVLFSAKKYSLPSLSLELKYCNTEMVVMPESSSSKTLSRFSRIFVSVELEKRRAKNQSGQQPEEDECVIPARRRLAE